MKRTLTHPLFAGSLAALISVSAQAELINADWLTAGDNQAVLDTVSGEKWLDLTVTDNRSIAEIEAELATTYQGWRIATRSEVHTLMSNAFPSATLSDGYNYLDNDMAPGAFASAEANAFFATFGYTNPGNHSYGRYLGDAPGSDEIFRSGLFRDTSLLVHQALPDDRNDFTGIDGVFLIYGEAKPIEDVPVPAGIGLVGLGLLGLAGLRRQLTH